MIRHFLLAAALAAVAFISQGHAQSCGTGFSAIAGGQCRQFVTTTGASNIAIPANWSNTNKLEVIGAGATGQPGNNTPGIGVGGGGGAYAAITNTTLIAPSTTITVDVGAASSIAGTAGGNSWICKDTSGCATLAGADVIVGCNGAPAVPQTGTQVGGNGASTTGCVGTTLNAGGSANTGQTSWATTVGPPGAGGGAGGPGGPGAGITWTLGTGGSNSVCAGGTGGGGASGGTAGADASGTCSATGGAGGNGPLGSGGGTGGTAGTTPTAGGAGSHGGGGGGGGNQLTGFDGQAGGNGGAGTDWDASHGAGGGGGSDGELGGGSTPAPGNGGLYGGGGAGGGDESFTGFGVGAQGIAVLTYTPSGGGATCIHAMPMLGAGCAMLSPPANDNRRFANDNEELTSPELSEKGSPDGRRPVHQRVRRRG